MTIAVVNKNCPIYKQKVAIQEIRTLKKVSYFDAKKLICPINHSYTQAAKSTVSPVPVVKEILPVVTHFIE